VHPNREGVRIEEVDGYPTSKRILDKALSASLLLVFSPVFAFVAGAMGADMLFRRRDRGPWLYREPRISRGREFELLKFRTLRRDVLEASAGEEAHARLLEADQANLTWAGRRVLKPWYLDELPQLWNVLRGDMSLVGPRPWPPSMVRSQVEKGFTYRNEFVAGWTGPAQVRKGVTESAGYTELDIEYISRCSCSSVAGMVRTDLGILWRTVRLLAHGEGLKY
jgi:lipopolysaccharide/colanic/teichoic acid biosynthesis glycosyltransferase